MTLENPISAVEAGVRKARFAAEIVPGIRYPQLPEGMRRYFAPGFTLSGPARREESFLLGLPPTIRHFDIHGNLIDERNTGKNSSNTRFQYDVFGRVTRVFHRSTLYTYGSEEPHHFVSVRTINYPGVLPEEDGDYVETHINYENGEEIYRNVSTSESRRRQQEYDRLHPGRGL